MKVLILAGGYGSRLGNITEAIPKPMVKIGRYPIIIHIMKYYASFGYRDFIISAGYKAEVIKEYFYNYKIFANDFYINLNNGDIKILSSNHDDNWKVTVIDTGVNSLKGARVKRVENYLDEMNLMTYGDGLADVNINSLVEFHKSHGKVLTITGVHPPARFGEIRVNGDSVAAFEEKPQSSVGIINGGYMVFNRELLEYLSVDEKCDLEVGPFNQLVKDKQVMVYQHKGSWECIDTERDLNHLNRIWNENKAFWMK